MTSSNEKYVIKASRLSNANQSFQYKVTPAAAVGKKRDSRHFIVINEERLISHVQARPILFDKALKGYRKPTVREQAWQEVAEAVSSTVEESKKRWRSLRDAFMKQYKQISNDDPLFKKKKWLFYDQMEFLGPYLELNYGAPTISQYNPNAIDYDAGKNTEEFLYKSEFSEHDQDSADNDNKQLKYCVLQQNDSCEEILEEDEVEHMDECSDQADDEEIIDIYDDSEIISEIFPKAHSSVNEHTNVIEICENPEGDEQQQNTPIVLSENFMTSATTTAAAATSTSVQASTMAEPTTESASPNVNSIKDIEQHNTSVPTSEQCSPDAAITNACHTDSNEKFLLSCAPILRRLSDKKNCLARLRIQQILYEIEFGEQNELIF